MGKKNKASRVLPKYDSFPFCWGVSESPCQSINPTSAQNLFFIPMKSPIKAELNETLKPDLRWSVTDAISKAKSLVSVTPDFKFHAINVAATTELIKAEDWASANVSYHQCPFPKPLDISSLSEFISLIDMLAGDSTSQIIFVYSGKGLNRPALAITSYLIERCQTPFDEAISLLRKTLPNCFYSPSALEMLATFSKNEPPQAPLPPPYISAVRSKFEDIRLPNEHCSNFRKVVSTGPMRPVPNEPVEFLRGVLQEVGYPLNEDGFPIFRQSLWGSMRHASADEDTVSSSHYKATFNPVGTRGFLVIRADSPMINTPNSAATENQGSNSGNAQVNSNVSGKSICFIENPPGLMSTRSLASSLALEILNLGNSNDITANSPIVMSVVYADGPRRGVMMATDLILYGQRKHSEMSFEERQSILASEIIPKLSPATRNDYLLEFAYRPLASLDNAERLFNDTPKLFFESNGICLASDAMTQEIVIANEVSLTFFVVDNGGNVLVLYGKDESGKMVLLTLIKCKETWASGLHENFVKFSYNGDKWVPKALARDMPCSTVYWFNEVIDSSFSAGTTEHAFAFLKTIASNE